MIKQLIETISVLEAILTTDILGPVDDAGLNRSSRRVILVIGKFEGLPMGKLQHRASMVKGNFSLLCKKLKKSGYIEPRRSTDDRRRVHIYLTDSGRKLYRKYEQIIIQRYSDFFDKLNAAQQFDFQEFIKDMSDIFGG